MGGHRKQTAPEQNVEPAPGLPTFCIRLLSFKIPLQGNKQKAWASKPCSSLLQIQMSFLDDWYLKAFLICIYKPILNVKFGMESSMWAFSSCAFNCFASFTFRKESSQLGTLLGIRAYWVLTEPLEQSRGAVGVQSPSLTQHVLDGTSWNRTEVIHLSWKGFS